MPLNTKQHIKKTLMTGLLWLTASLIHGQSIDLATTLKNNDNDHLKTLWQKAFTEYNTQTFNAIWNNHNLRTSLFDINSSISPLDQFNNMASNTNSVLYSFIKAE